MNVASMSKLLKNCIEKKGVDDVTLETKSAVFFLLVSTVFFVSTVLSSTVFGRRREY